MHQITQIRKLRPDPQADGSKWPQEPKPAKRQQRQHSAVCLCFTSPCSTMGDIMQLVEHLIKAGFCFPVWQDELLYWVNLERILPLLRMTSVSCCLEFYFINSTRKLFVTQFTGSMLLHYIQNFLVFKEKIERLFEMFLFFQFIFLLLFFFNQCNIYCIALCDWTTINHFIYC